MPQVAGQLCHAWVSSPFAAQRSSGTLATQAQSLAGAFFLNQVALSTHPRAHVPHASRQASKAREPSAPTTTHRFFEASATQSQVLCGSPFLCQYLESPPGPGQVSHVLVA